LRIAVGRDDCGRVRVEVVEGEWDGAERARSPERFLTAAFVILMS
jgi:hypothetical protein